MTTITLRRALLAAMLVATAGLGACNTAEGVGKDVESTGDAVQDTARDVKKKM
ncbi:MAG TPA: entericidin A/B family lipoprotein [Rhodospirillales bacterium]|nr:entericidin A/B family lipoprotein [Rhodospirillales bacterium]